MDAIIAMFGGGQFENRLFNRDLNKAFCGFNGFHSSQNNNKNNNKNNDKNNDNDNKIDNDNNNKNENKDINNDNKNNKNNKICVATGNWGCGAFGGDFHLKAFQQMLVFF